MGNECMLSLLTTAAVLKFLRGAELWCLCAATFAVQVVAGSDHVRVVWLHPQDPQRGVAQRRAKDGRLVLNVSAGKDDAHLNIPHSPFAHSLKLMFPPLMFREAQNLPKHKN